MSDAAHELRTPLTGVQAAAERLLLADPGRAVREQLSVTVIQEARRASRLVEDMLTMARIDQGLDLHRRPAELLALTRSTVQTKQLSHPGARISVDGHPVQVLVDADRYTQVLDNLLDNAIHAAGPHATIGVGISTNDADVQVDVVDDGPGIAAADNERIFDRLVRADPARTSHTGGYGLGLPIARGIARAHGGDLTLAPHRGAGARFRLTLPVASTPMPTAHPNSSSRPEPWSGPPGSRTGRRDDPSTVTDQQRGPDRSLR